MLSSKLKKYVGKEIEDYGGVKSPEFKNFASDLRSDLRKQAKEVNMEVVNFYIGHYYCSGFLKDLENGKFVYFSISEVRTWKDEWVNHTLYRTAKDEKDYTGGSNNYCMWEELAQHSKHLINR